MLKTRISTLLLLTCLSPLAAPMSAHAQHGLRGHTDAALPFAAANLMDEASSQGEALLNQGMEFLGIRYRFGSNNPDRGLDCSGFVQSVFDRALGVELPRTSGEMARLGEKISKPELQPGDLVFFNTMRRAFSHVGIYMGEGKFLHSASRGGGVRIDHMGQNYWAQRFNGARRLLPDSASGAGGFGLR